MRRRNLIASYLGQICVAVMGLAFIPIYIEYLGIEAYALIGFFALLQTVLSLLDVTMTPTLGREMARFTAGISSANAVRDLLRTIEFIIGAIAIFFLSALALGANWIAGSWLKSSELPVATVSNAILIMGIVVALRFLESIYRSCIIGMQHHILFHSLNSTMAVIRNIGAVLVLVSISASIEAFFLWQGVVSLVSLVLMAYATYANIPTINRVARLSLSAVRSIWQFARGMLIIALLSLLLTQIDKILLSTLIPLDEYGSYTLAAVVAGSLYMVLAPVTSVLYPRLCELLSQNLHEQFAETYHHAAQMVSVLAGSVAVLFIVYADTILLIWTQDEEIVSSTSSILSLLMIGNLLNGIMHIPYYAQLAHGWTSLTIRINLICIAAFVPLIFWVTPRYGGEGAAWVWVALNSTYFLLGVQFMYRRILVLEKWRWYISDVLMPLLASAAVLVVARLVLTWGGGGLHDTMRLVLVFGLASSAAIAMAPYPRTIIFNYIFEKERFQC